MVLILGARFLSIEVAMDSRVAVLFCDPKGVYSGIDGLDLWSADRDARLYQGPDPVVAHPPCARWCRLAKLVASQGGKPVGDDDGCFASALASVRRWGGVLEHPAHSLAWAAYDLLRPVRGAWMRGTCGSWVCEVDQSHYGHRAISNAVSVRKNSSGHRQKRPRDLVLKVFAALGVFVSDLAMASTTAFVLAVRDP